MPLQPGSVLQRRLARGTVRLSRCQQTAGRRPPAKTPSQLISLDLWVSGLHVSGMKILLMMAVVESLNLVIFAWFNRVAGLRCQTPQGCRILQGKQTKVPDMAPIREDEDASEWPFRPGLASLQSHGC